jgi:hypothetical protein
MDVLKDESAADNPAVKAFLNDVLIAEQKAFDRVFTRFCLLNGLKFETAFMSIETTYINPHRPNYGEYHFKGNTLNDKTVRRHFLMSRDLVMVEGQELPTLEIKWNVNLLDETIEN